MPTALAKTEEERVSLRIPTPVLNVIDKTLARLIKKNLSEVIADTNTALERGVKTDETAVQADAVVAEGRQAVKIVNEVRLSFTRPIDQGKKNLMDEVERMLAPLKDGNNRLNTMCIKRAQEIQAEADRIAAENERRIKEAEEAARKREEHNRNISLGKGGDGNVAPVQPEPVAPVVSTAGMRSTTRMRSIVAPDKIQAAMDEGVREIPGVSFFQVWQFEVTDSKAVPKKYRRDVRG